MAGFAHSRILCVAAFMAAAAAARAQFKETPPAPYSQAVAHQRIAKLLESVDPGNLRETTATLSGLLVWYRDIVDDELIAAWKKNDRANLPPLVTALADARVASSIVEYSWREQRTAAFTLAYAPMLGDLMARYPASADPFLRDLLGSAGTVTDLPQGTQDAICRILLDMPDTGGWKKTAQQILPRYKETARTLLLQDLQGTDQEKTYRARFWLADLKLPIPGLTDDPPQPRRPLPRPAPPQPASDGLSQRPHIVSEPAASTATDDGADGPLRRRSPGPPPSLYSGPASGTLKCSGGPIAPNTEYVFSGMPLGNIQLDLDGEIWAARLVLAPNQTQDLILKNKGVKAQKKCTVRWSVIP